MPGDENSEMREVPSEDDVVQQVVEEVLRSRPDLTREQVERMIDGKVKEFGGIIRRDAAALIVAKELGVALSSEPAPSSRTVFKAGDHEAVEKVVDLILRHRRDLTRSDVHRMIDDKLMEFEGSISVGTAALLVAQDLGVPILDKLPSLDCRVDVGLGEFLVSRLRSAKRRLWVVSPQISPEFVKLLLEAKSRGVDVRLVTTNHGGPRHWEALRSLIAEQRLLASPVRLLVNRLSALLIIAGILISLTLGPYWLLMSFFGLLAFMSSRNAYRIRYVPKIGEGKLAVYRSRQDAMVHARLYLVDDTLGIGSPHLTAAGVKKNLEALCWISDPDVVERIAEQIEGMCVGIPGFSKLEIGLD